MLSKKVKLRIFFLVFLLVLAVGIIFFTLKSLEDNVVYFFSPSDINKKSNITINQKIRVGGLVKKNSIKQEGSSINFVITDLKYEVLVSYNGIIPNLFSEGKGVIVEGKLKDKKYFVASKILAKHDENYMPPEVAETLEKPN